VYNKAHPSILLHVKDSTNRKTIILLLQEIKQDIIYRHAQLSTPCSGAEVHERIQARLLAVTKKFSSLLKYQGVLPLQYFFKLINYMKTAIMEAAEA
jgi:hypothetical protein